MYYVSVSYKMGIDEWLNNLGAVDKAIEALLGKCEDAGYGFGSRDLGWRVETVPYISLGKLLAVFEGTTAVLGQFEIHLMDAEELEIYQEEDVKL
jgi:hypothetical protein